MQKVFTKGELVILGLNGCGRVSKPLLKGGTEIIIMSVAQFVRDIR
jgi:hypothetical protein